MLYYMLNKPEGLITACSDRTRPTVMTLFPETLAAALHPVGRLDRDTHGLLLFTDDGRVDHALLIPECHVEKTYEFCAIGQMTEEKKTALENGVPIGDRISRPACFTLTDAGTVWDYRAFLPEYCRQRYLKNPTGAAFLGSLRIQEGRKHQVKLMLRAVGCHICYLKRTAIGQIRLDLSLAEGEYRPLTADEVAYLTQRIDDSANIEKV